MDTKERDIFIREKLNEGMSLSDVQHALAEEFGIRMTYLDLRMLAATLPVEWENQDRTKAQPAKVAEKPTVAEKKAEKAIAMSRNIQVVDIDVIC